MKYNNIKVTFLKALQYRYKSIGFLSVKISLTFEPIEILIKKKLHIKVVGRILAISEQKRAFLFRKGGANDSISMKRKLTEKK